MVVPDPNPPGTVTRAANAIIAGTIPTDVEPAVSRIYDELRIMAGSRVLRDAGATIEPTDLVSEAFLKLFRPGGAPWQNRRHFFGSAARAMQQILIDHWRGRSNRDAEPLMPDAILALTPDPSSLAEAIDRLGRQDQSLAEIIRLRVFAGLSVKQTAELLDLSERTIKRRFTFAKLWIYREMQDLPRPPAP